MELNYYKVSFQIRYLSPITEFCCGNRYLALYFRPKHLNIYRIGRLYQVQETKPQKVKAFLDMRPHENHDPSNTYTDTFSSPPPGLFFLLFRGREGGGSLQLIAINSCRLGKRCYRRSFCKQ